MNKSATKTNNNNNNRNKNDNKSLTQTKVNQNKKKNRKNLNQSINESQNLNNKQDNIKTSKKLLCDLNNQNKLIKSTPEHLSTMVKKSLILTNKPPELKTSSDDIDLNKLNSTNDNQPVIKKMERSNSFFLTRKLSKLFGAITGSKENISLSTAPNDIDKKSNDELPYKFSRSRSMILLRPSKRRSVIEPKLEQLCEESEKAFSQEPIDNTTSISNVDIKPNIIQNDLQQNKQRKSVTLVGTLKRTFSNSSSIIPTDKLNRKSLNSKWSSSLLSLQEIDNMVSYENLSFIDYDKFNEYERTLEQRLLQKPSNIDYQLPSKDVPVIRREKRGRTGINDNEPISLAIEPIFDQNSEILEQVDNNFGCYSLDDKKLQKLKQLYGNDFKQYDNLLTLNQINCENYKNSSCKSMPFIGQLPSSTTDIGNTVDVIDSANIVIMDDTKKIKQISKEKQLRYTKRTEAILLDSTSSSTSSNNQNINNNNKNLNEPKNIQQRKLIRSPEVSVCDIPASVVSTVAATVTDVMGGSRDDGLLTPNHSILLDFNVNQSNNKNLISAPIKSTSLQNIIIAENLIYRDTKIEVGERSNSHNNEYKNNKTTFLCNNSEEYEQELSILNNLNIDTTSELTFTDSYSSSCGRNSGRGCINLGNITTKFQRESPIRYVDCDDNSIMGSDLSTSAASAKLTSGNTSLSGESSTSGGFGSSLEAPPPTLTRLQNFLFNKSNDSTKSFEGGIINEQNSNPLSPKLIERSTNTSNNYINYTTPGSTTTATTTTTTNDNLLAIEDEAYYLQSTSQNNPFLPDIIAKKNNSYEETSKYVNLYRNVYNPNEQYIYDGSGQENLKLNTSYLTNSGGVGGFSPISENEKPIISGNTKSHELEIKKIGDGNTRNIEEVKSPSTRRSKFFSLISPTSESNDNKLQQKLLKKKNSPQSSIKRSFNPFLRHNQEQQQADLNAKREEFLKATMKICLVVSPPTNKLQLKSKSLTHLDVLDSMVACHQEPSPPPAQQPSSNVSEQMDIQPEILNDKLSRTISPTICSGTGTSTCIYQPQYYTNNSNYQSISSTTTNSCNKICCIGQQTSIGSAVIIDSISPNDIEYCNIPVNKSSGALAATLNAASIHPVGLSTSNVQQSQLNSSQYKPTQQQQQQQQQQQCQHGSIKKKSSFINRKKPILTRSTVSSSEYFSVSFNTEIGYDVEEFIPITKGMTLSEALSSALKMRNLNFSQIIISDNNLQNFCESETPPYTITLDENTDIERLAGKHLIATEKDNIFNNKKNGSLQKAASFGSKVRPPRLLSSASTEETSSEFEQKVIPGKQLKQRWSGLFGIKNPQQAQLCELLNRYAKFGVPQKLSSVNFDHPEFDSALDYLDNIHSSWQEFVQHDKIPENEIKIQSAIWELVTTEVDYIHALQTVTGLFLACLEAIQKERILVDIDQMKLFSNIRDICEANLKFWIHYLYPMVAYSIKTQNPLCINYFQPGFLTFATNFGPYKKYCAEQSTCQFYCKELNQNNAVFATYLAWCESQKMCNRLRLADILVRPMQRLTKYSLLLTAIRKHICDENDSDIIDSMIHSVENFVYSVNTHLTTRQENERLKGIMARIEAYDVVDASNEQLEKVAKQYSQMFDLCAPMNGCSPTQCRHLFMEGDIKFKDNISKNDVHCFLLTDILLICKTIAKRGQGILKVIRQPYMTDRLIVKHKENSLHCVYLNEFQVAVAAFTLQCSEAKNWLDGITKAKHIYSRLKQGSNWDGYNYRLGGNNICGVGVGGGGGGGGVGVSGIGNNSCDNTGNNMLGVKKSPLNSSIGSRVSSLNNSHSGSMELNDSRNISVDFDKTNSLSSDEGSLMSNQISQKPKTLVTSPHQQRAITSNTLKIHPVNNLGQSLPNLNIHNSQASNNTLLVPDHISSISGNLLLSPCHRGISYPPPSPTRATLRRGMAFSNTLKNPPLVKSRNITSQNSINWHQQNISTQSITPPTSPNQQLPPQLSTNSIVTTPGNNLTNQESDV